MALRYGSERLERRFSFRVSFALVLEHRGPSDSAMAASLGQLRNLSSFEQLDQRRARNVEQVSGFLRGNGIIVLDYADVFAGQKQLRCSFDSASQRFNQIGQHFRGCFARARTTDNGNKRAGGFFARAAKRWRTLSTRLRDGVCSHVTAPSKDQEMFRLYLSIRNDPRNSSSFLSGCFLPTVIIRTKASARHPP